MSNVYGQSVINNDNNDDDHDGWGLQQWPTSDYNKTKQNKILISVQAVWDKGV